MRHTPLLLLTLFMCSCWGSGHGEDIPHMMLIYRQQDQFRYTIHTNQDPRARDTIFHCNFYNYRDGLTPVGGGVQEFNTPPSYTSFNRAKLDEIINAYDMSVSRVMASERGYYLMLASNYDGANEEYEPQLVEDGYIEPSS